MTQHLCFLPYPQWIQWTFSLPLILLFLPPPLPPPKSSSFESQSISLNKSMSESLLPFSVLPNLGCDQEAQQTPHIMNNMQTPAYKSSSSSTYSVRGRRACSNPNKVTLTLHNGVQITVDRYFYVNMARSRRTEKIDAHIICAEGDDLLKQFYKDHNIHLMEDQRSFAILRRKLLSRGYSKGSRVRAEEKEKALRASVQESQRRLKPKTLESILSSLLTLHFGAYMVSGECETLVSSIMQRSAPQLAALCELDDQCASDRAGDELWPRTTGSIPAYNPLYMLV